MRRLFNAFAGFGGTLAHLARVGFGTIGSRLAALGTSVLVARLADARTFGEFTLFSSVFILISESASALDTVYLRNVAARGTAQIAALQAEHLISKALYAVVVGLIGLTLDDFIATAS